MSLSSPTVLLRSASTVVGVSAGSRPYEVLVTLHQQGLYLYDTRTQSCLRSWQVRAGTQLTHAACLHEGSGRLVGVREQTVLFSWPMDGGSTVDLGSATHTVGKPVLTLLHSPHLLDAIVVVMLDGSALVLDAYLSREIGRAPALAGSDLSRSGGGIPSFAS